jgi:preprotein translocase subunit SecB
MNLSPLQLDNYFLRKVVHEIAPGFDPTKPIGLRMSDIVVETDATPIDTDRRLWKVDVTVRDVLAAGINIPYAFHIHLTGQFRVHPRFPDDRIERLVRVNATGVLYSTVREILRALMSQGPYGSMLLPALNFNVSGEEAVAASSRTPSTPAASSAMAPARRQLKDVAAAPIKPQRRLRAR